MSTPRHASPSSSARQQGAVTVIVVLFLLLVLGAALGTILQTSGSGATDATAQDDSVAALFLAESAVEHALGRLQSVGCGAGLAVANTALGRGNFSVLNNPAPAAVGANCQVDVRGTVGTVTRTARVLLNAGGGTITASAASIASGLRLTSSPDTLTFAHTVTAGQTLLLVGISVDRTDTSLTQVPPTYNNLPLTQSISAPATNTSRPKAEIWYLLNPPVGAFNVVVTLRSTAAPKDEVIAGAMSFAGVSTTAPFDVPAVTARGTSSSPASVTITPITNGAWVFDVLAVNNNPNVTMGPMAGRVQLWNLAVSTRVRGAASTLGPINPALAQNLAWTWTSGNRDWTLAAVALRPGGSPQLLQWRELIN